MGLPTQSALSLQRQIFPMKIFMMQR